MSYFEVCTSLGGGSKLVRQEVKDLPLFARKEHGFVCQPNLKCVVIAGIG